MVVIGQLQCSRHVLGTYVEQIRSKIQNLNHSEYLYIKNINDIYIYDSTVIGAARRDLSCCGRKSRCERF